jgi:beta-lactamase class A
MRFSPLPAGLIVFAVLAAGCVAVKEPPGGPPTPVGIFTQQPGFNRSTLPTPDANGTPAGRLPQQAAAPTPEPVAPASFTPDPALQKQLETLLGDQAEHYGVYVKDLATGKGAALNPGKVFNAASLFKVEVMYEVFRQRALDLLKFDELLEVTPYYADFDLGTRQVGIGQSESIAEALFYMMSISDNISAVLLQDRAGAGNINTTMSALGLQVTGLFTEALPATAEDFGVLMEAIARNPDVDDDSRTQMFDLLTSETIDNGIVAGVPKGTKVAHKTGNWSDATNDAGIVFGPRGNYVIVVLSDTDHDPSGTMSVSDLVYRYLEGSGSAR